MLDRLYAVITVWVITWRTAWPAVVLWLVLFAASLAQPKRLRIMSARQLLLMSLPAGLPIIWGGLNWADWQRGVRGKPWQSNVQVALTLCALAALIIVAVRTRRSTNWWLLSLAVVSVLTVLFLGAFVGSMAIIGEWL